MKSVQSSSVVRLWATMLAGLLTGCGAFSGKPSADKEFAPITNKSSWDCLQSDNKTPIDGCEIEGKLILTDPTKNITYVLYRSDDTTRSHPIPCTLPAQAAAALSSSSTLGLSIPVHAAGLEAAASANASQSQTAQIISLGNNAAPALYVLASNFSLCLAYGFGALTDKMYADDLLNVTNKAVTLGSSSSSGSSSGSSSSGSSSGSSTSGGSSSGSSASGSSSGSSSSGGSHSSSSSGAHKTGSSSSDGTSSGSAPNK